MGTGCLGSSAEDSEAWAQWKEGHDQSPMPAEEESYEYPISYLSLFSAWVLSSSPMASDAQIYIHNPNLSSLRILHSPLECVLSL